MKKTTQTQTQADSTEKKAEKKKPPTAAKDWHSRTVHARAWLASHPDATEEEKAKHRVPTIDFVRARGWMLTIPVEGDHPHTADWVRAKLSHAQAAVFSEEKGNHTGYLHFQTFVYYRNAPTGKRMKKIWNTKEEGIHIEPSWSTTELCANYCSKEATHMAGPYWIGHPEQVEGMKPTTEQTARRGRYDELIEVLRSGRTYDQLVLDPEWGPWALSNPGKIRDVRAAILAQTVGCHDREVSCDYVYGAPGSGKTSSVLKLYGNETIFRAMCSSSFPFDGYDGQEVLLLDDYRGGLSFSELLLVLDNHPLPLNVKGSRTWAAWKKVVITSNIPLSKQYGKVQESHDPLLRRFERGIVFEKPDPATELPYANREDAMIGRRNDGGQNGAPGYVPRWERTPEQQADAAIDDAFDSLMQA